MDMAELFKDEPNFFLLESSLYDPQRGRFSFLGYRPFDVFSSDQADALTVLKAKYENYYEKDQNSLALFSSGIVGYLSYEHGLKQENIISRKERDIHVPDCYFGFYDTILTVDHLLKKITITSTGLPEKNLVLRKKRAQERLDQTAHELSKLRIFKRRDDRDLQVLDEKDLLCPIRSNFTKENYLKAVRKILDHIAVGDVYQINLAQRFEINVSALDAQPIELYKILRRLSPTQFGGFFRAEDFSILSSSPERFLSIKNNVIEVRPMKGTRPRGQDASSDQKFKTEIIQSQKEKAELLMITDLMRSDLGRVCDFGSIKVKELRTIEEYRTVFQATASIDGRLRAGQDCFDVLKACFPGGSITGCPKIRAMEIINELEPDQRSIYTGSLGYVSFSGNADFNILIRSMLFSKGKIYFHAGSGIVADSDPELEYEETLSKAKAMRLAGEYLFHEKNILNKT